MPVAVLVLNPVIPLEFCFNCSILLIFVSYSVSHLTPLSLKTPIMQKKIKYTIQNTIAYIIKVFGVSLLCCQQHTNSCCQQHTKSTGYKYNFATARIILGFLSAKKPTKPCIEFCLTR